MPKTKIQIKSRWFVDKVLFEYESDNNSLKRTLEEAVENGADLRDANLRDADLHDADLYGANLRGAKNSELVAAKTLIVPEGSIIGWKKCRDGKIVKLLIPETAKRHNATGRKCRAEFAEVLKIYPAGKKRALAKTEVAYSQHDYSFVYKVGETVKPTTEFDENRWDECSSGIHFFITREEAEAY